MHAMIVIKYRVKKPIVQMQLDDYVTRRAPAIYEMWVPKDYRRARKCFKMWLPVQDYHHKIKSTITKHLSKKCTLDAFMPKITPPILPKPAYLLRFRSIQRFLKDDHVRDSIPNKEWILVQSMKTFTGFFNHMFNLNDFSKLDAFQERLENEDISFKHIAIHDVVAFELLRLQLGFHDYTGLEKIYYFIGGNPLHAILRDQLFFPSAADVSYVMTRIPSKMLKEFYHDLVDEAIALKIIVPRILVWDTQFVHSNCNDNKDKIKKSYNDADAGYGRHIGKKLGVGYSVSNLYAYCGSWNRAFLVHFDVFPANMNDKPIFRRTLSNFLKRDVGKWSAIIGDTGAYSLDNLKFCMARGIHPFLRAMKNLKLQPVVEIRKGYWFNSNFIPPGWTNDDVRAIYTKRPVIEARQAANDTFYNASRMNTRGIENIERNRAMIGILELLRAITAVKLGRPDLISKLTAFSTSRDVFTEDSWVERAVSSGFQVLIPSAADIRRKELEDKWRRDRENRKKSENRVY
jgi:hypothetical protein